jgi:hypothetical protein
MRRRKRFQGARPQMPDTYHDWSALAHQEREGEDYPLRIYNRGRRWLVIASHVGGIETWNNRRLHSQLPKRT